jgi:glycosyltransferase involved in cell wall biosynthesis
MLPCERGSRPVRVLVVSPNFPPAAGMGGSQEAAADLTETLSGSHSVRVLTTDFARGGAVQTAGDEWSASYRGSQVTRLHAPTARHVQYSLFLREWPRIRQMVREADAILISDLRTLLNVVVALNARRARVPYGLLPWGSGGVALEKRRRLVRGVWDWSIGRLVVAGARTVFAQTELEAGDLKRLPGTRRVDLIPLGIRITSLPDPTPIVTINHDAPLRVVCIARLHPLKNIEVLVRATARLKTVRLDVVGGDHGSLSDLVDLIDSLDCAMNVRLLGPVYPPALYESLLAYDCVLLAPKYNEGTSRAVLLACWLGCAPIVSAQVDLPQLEEYSCGWRTEANVDAVVCCLKAALVEKRSGQLVARRSAAQRMVHEIHDVAINSEQYLRALA